MRLRYNRVGDAEKWRARETRRGGQNAVQEDATRSTREVKVLLVEDEPLTRQVVATFLEDAGYDVTATCTGDEALILLNEDLFGILLTDITMPGQIDGIGLAEHAREIHPGLPVVFVSGRPGVEERVRALDQPTAFFAKPCDARSLVGAVDRLTHPVAVTPPG